MTHRFWTITGSVAALLFILLTVLLHAFPGAINSVDSLIQEGIAPFQTYGAIQAWLVITALGGGVGIISVAIGFGYMARLSSANVLRLAFALAASSTVVKVVKELLARIRPDALMWFDSLLSFSFPSAHAAASLILYGFISAHIYASAKRSRHRLLLALIPLLIPLLVGVSRVILGVHHFSDVIGGYLLGIVLLSLACAFPFERFIRSHE